VRNDRNAAVNAVNACLQVEPTHSEGLEILKALQASQ
jgi:hypothetical protein